MAQRHNTPLDGDVGGPTIAPEHDHAELTPLLRVRKNKTRKCWLSRLKDHVFVKSKAANMILLWNFLVSLLYGILSTTGYVNPNGAALSTAVIAFGGPLRLALSVIFPVAAYSYSAICYLFYPLAGYLGDVHCGRYKTVRCGLWTLWIALLSVVVCCAIVLPITFCTDLVFQPQIPPWFWVLVAFCSLVAFVALIALLTGFAVFNANIIQFGMDQLQDSPARNSSLFIFWYLATYYFGIGIGKVVLSFLLQMVTLPSAVIISIIIIIIILTFLLVTPTSLCVSRCRQIRRWFVPAPRIGNPYKLVRKVTSFAWKHKVPIQRSAFTYWEENIPSGLDLGKDKYGGPFTTEQVEDVKAFFGLLKVLLSLGPFFMADFAASDFLSLLGSHMEFKFIGYGLHSEFLSVNGGALYPLFVVGMILLYIITPQRYMEKYTPGMLKRIGIGLLLITLSMICSLTMDAIGHTQVGNLNATCIFGPPQLNYSYFSLPKIQTLDISANFLLIQNILTAVAYILIYSGIFEFICAQSPHSMKGFLIGLLFAIKGLFRLLGIIVVYIPFNFWYFTVDVTVNFPSCGFIYYLVNIIISIIGVVVFIYAAKKYKYRQRDEFCDNRRYIEEYYEHVVNHNPPPDPDE